MKIRKQCINPKLWGFCTRFDVLKTIVIPRKEAELDLSFRNLFSKYYGILLKDLIAKKSNYEFTNNNGNFLLFYGFVNARFDHRKTFNDFSSRFSDADVLSGYKEKKNIPHPFNFINGVIHLIIWFFQLLVFGCGVSESLFYLPHVYDCYVCDKQLGKIKTGNYKFVAVYYDVSTDDNFVVQFFQSLGIVTMTLQHGIFAKKKRIDGISDFGLEFEFSIADYYLCWNQYSKEEAVKVGMNENKIKVLGMPKYINYGINTTQKNNTEAPDNVFGVILNSLSFDKYNVRLVEMANDIADALNMKYILRYHPQLSGREYSDLCGQRYIGNDDNHTTIQDYSSHVKFTIISSSSVFIDLVYLNHPTYRLALTENDTYSSVRYNAFKNLNEFLKVYSDEKPLDEEIFTYLCTTRDVYDNYRKFFNEFLR